MVVIFAKFLSGCLAEVPEEAESFAALRSKGLCLQVIGSQQNLILDLSKLNRSDFFVRK